MPTGNCVGSWVLVDARAVEVLPDPLAGFIPVDERIGVRVCDAAHVAGLSLVVHGVGEVAMGAVAQLETA